MRIRLAPGVLAFVVALTVSACSSGETSAPTAPVQTGPGQSAAPLTKESITVSEQPGSSNLIFWHTYYSGGFAAENLDVTTVALGTGSTQVVSGTADVQFNGLTPALAPARDGKETIVLMAYVGNGVGSFIYSGNSVQSVKDCKKMASNNAPGYPYGYVRLLKEAFGATYEIIGVGADAGPSGLAAGTYDCATGPLSSFGSVISAGKAKILFDTRLESQRPAAFIGNLSEGVLYGLKDVVQRKQEAITRLMRAMYKTWVTTFKPANADPATIAALIKGKGGNDWVADQAALTFTVQSNLGHFYMPLEGYIDQATWAKDITFNGKYAGIDVNATDAVWSYARRVDMSLYEKAIGKPK